MFYILLAIFISMPLCSATDALPESNDSALVQSFYEAFRKRDSATLLSMIAEAEKRPNSQFCLWLKEEGLTDKGQGELDMGSVGYPNLYEEPLNKKKISEVLVKEFAKFCKRGKGAMVEGILQFLSPEGQKQAFKTLKGFQFLSDMSVLKACFSRLSIGERHDLLMSFNDHENKVYSKRLSAGWIKALLNEFSYEQRKDIVNIDNGFLVRASLVCKNYEVVKELLEQLGHEDRVIFFKKVKHDFLSGIYSAFEEGKASDLILSLFSNDELQEIVTHTFLIGSRGDVLTRLHGIAMHCDKEKLAFFRRLLGLNVFKDLMNRVEIAHGLTPAMLAAKNGQLSVLKLFVEEGLDINALNSKGQCPLDVAVHSIQPEMRSLGALKGEEVQQSRRHQAFRSKQYAAGGVSALLVALIAPYIAESIEFSHRYSKALREVRKKNPWGITRKEREELQKEVLKQCTFRSDGKAVRTFRLILSLGGVALLGRAIALYLPVKDAHKRPVAERS